MFDLEITTAGSNLPFLLPTALAAAKNCPVRCSVLMLDNRSPEPDVDWVRQNFPTVKIVVAPENDFLFSYNWLLPQLSEDIVVILNSDLRLDEHFLAPLLRHFQSPDVFAVSASSFDWEGAERTIGPARLTFSNGMYGWYYGIAAAGTFTPCSLRQDSWRWTGASFWNLAASTGFSIQPIAKI